MAGPTAKKPSQPKSVAQVAGFEKPLEAPAEMHWPAEETASEVPMQDRRDREPSLTKIPSKYRKFAKGN